MVKSFLVEEFVNETAKAIFGMPLSEAHRLEICIDCKRPIKLVRWRDALSKAEYALSGFCQTCQDKIFLDSFRKKA